MSFKSDIPDYRSYSEDEYYMQSVPLNSNIWSSLSGLILRAADENGIKDILDEFAKLIPCTPSTNWGYEYLKNEIPDFVGAIKRKVSDGKIYILMDCLAAMIEGSFELMDDVNDFLDENGIGYFGYMDTMTRDITWQVKEESIVIEKMKEQEKMQSEVVLVQWKQS